MWLKKILKILCWIIAIYLVVVVLEYARIAIVHDYSLQPIAHAEKTDPPTPETFSKPPVILISYASGQDYYLQNQNAMAASAMNKGIDFVYNYRRAHIDQHYFDQHKDLLSRKQGGGLWLWKPYFIYETLKKSPENAIILYLDAGFVLYKPIFPLLKYLDDKDIVLFHSFGGPLYNGTYVRGDVFSLMNCTDDACRKAPLLASGVMLIRNTQQSRDFFKQWLTACEDKRLLDPTPLGIRDNYPEFKWSFFEGALLSILAHKNPEDIKILGQAPLFESIYWSHRKPGPASPNKRLYTLYGVKHIASRKRTGKALTGLSIINFPPLIFLRKWMLDFYYDLNPVNAS